MAPALYDPSPEAAENYRAWVVYEMNQPQDQGRSFEVETYPEGVSVCSKLAFGLSLTEIKTRLSDEKGWTGSGSQAIIKGAVNALCPRYNTGYQTYFDRNVTAASNALVGALPWDSGFPAFYEVGYFMKAACQYLEVQGSAVGLMEYLVTFRAGGQNQHTHAAGFVQRIPSDLLLRRATHHVVFGGCLGYHQYLNGYWTMA